MKKTIVLICILALICVGGVMAETTMNFLTKGFADTLYCHRFGTCTLTSMILDNLIVQNLSVIGDIFNVTMIRVNWTITDSFNVEGNLEAVNITAENYFYPDGTSINDTLSSDYVPYTGATDDVDLGTNDFSSRDGSFSGDVVVTGQTDLYGIFYSYNQAIFNNSIYLGRDGDSIITSETTDTTGSSQFRLLADGNNDLYIYTYGSEAAGTYYGLPRNKSSYVDAQGERLIIGTFDDSPMYLASSRDARLILTENGDFIPYDDNDIITGNASNRWKDIYVVGEESKGIHFVEDDGSYGNLSMDDDFNLLWNGVKIVNGSGNITMGGIDLSPYLTNGTDANFNNINITGTTFLNNITCPDGTYEVYSNIDNTGYNITTEFVNFGETGFRVNATFNSTTNVMSVKYIIKPREV